MKAVLEVIAFNIESCIIAERAGADRIELCDNPGEGGTTPSYGFVKLAREKTSIDLFPIIRPRGGDFLYSENEFEIMKADVLMCKQLGCDGVVVGLLKKDGTVDTARSKELVRLAYPMSVTFHRAFDRTSEPFQALEDIIDCGCERILTSGQQPSVNEGAALIKQLIEKAANRIIIMPGSGVRADNLSKLLQSIGACEWHSSARIKIESEMQYNQPNMKETLTEVMLHANEVSQMKEILTEIDFK